MIKIVIIGARGQLGTDLCELFAQYPNKYDVVALNRQDINICNYDNTRGELYSINPSIVINTAAFNKVDDCELVPGLAFETNTIAVHNLARVCSQLGIPLVHFSTDYVFNGLVGHNPFDENDATFPANVYAASKLAGENVLRSTWHKHFIIRTSGLYGRSKHGQKDGGNFVEIVLDRANKDKSISVVDDQYLSPTSTFELARRVLELIQTEAYGLYHLTAGGLCSWYIFAQAIFELANTPYKINPITTESYGAKANRPRYSVLSNEKICSIGITPMIYWKDALDNYLKLTGRK